MCDGGGFHAYSDNGSDIDNDSDSDRYSLISYNRHGKTQYISADSIHDKNNMKP